MDTILLRIIDIIVRTFDPDTIILFGSRARGDAREDSDFDICVLKEGIS
jgi:predicted nucleotidyltransferase